MPANPVILPTAAPAATPTADTMWTNIRTSNVFIVSEIRGTDVVYHSPAETESSYVKPLDWFMRYFRPATMSEAVEKIEALAQEVRRLDVSTEEPGLLVSPSARSTFDRLVCYPETRVEIDIGVTKVVRAPELERVWGMSEVDASKRTILNFYGPPGTGKTMSAECLAASLELKLYIVDYAAVIGIRSGDTARAIRAVFAAARRHQAVLLFDEADAMVSRRIGMDGDINAVNATSINQNRNVLMQELDRHNGVVVLSTNFFTNYDPAMLRRIAHHVGFRLPNKEMRRKLFKLHLPPRGSVTINDAEWNTIADETDGFSGGDIRTVMTLAVTKSSMTPDSSQWKLAAAAVTDAIRYVKESKQAHNGQADFSPVEPAPAPAV